MRDNQIMMEKKATIQEYQHRTAEVKASMDWEDYLKLSDIAQTNFYNAVDLAWRLGYQAGKAALASKIKNHFSEKGGADR